MDELVIGCNQEKIMKKIKGRIYKIIFAVAPVLLTLGILLGIRHYLGHLESDYTFLISKVLKQKEYFYQASFHGETEPDAPDLQINGQTILGIDSNLNGIRDDIDIWLNRSALNKEETDLMRGYARQLQIVLKNCTLKKNALPAVEADFSNAEKKLLENGAVMRKEKDFTVSRLKLLTLNTEERSKCFN